ncbi:ATP-binding protein [Limnobacter sp.]|uniref:sensor histidine kinase n=1 Tax=Limnobacter sp. TaxID=2003368 RepID=UPI0027323AF7|nr:ATP-binding protein [Limnobacter sp.]MDP3187221.1 ATP-binding protein [Limnobacter sp.]
MGKLFWKFFFGFWLCLIAAAVATGTALYLMREKPASSDIAEGPRAQFMLETIQEVLEGKGPDALRDLLDRNRKRTGHAIPVFAVSNEGDEILNREVPENIQQRIAALFGGLEQPEQGILMVTAQNNSQWILFIPRNRRPPNGEMDTSNEPQKPDGKHQHREALEPPLPPMSGPGLFAALLASLLFAGLLAYTFSRPLNTLKNAFREAGKGRLGVRISGASRSNKKRSDEIGELLSGFDHMAEEIETRIEQQKALLHDVSHELRSPLARLNLAVGLARQNPAHLDASLSRIETEAERLDNLIGQLLNLSRLDTNQNAEILQEHNVIELLLAVVEDAQFEAEQQDKHVELSGTVKQWNLRCHAESLQGAFDNIIRNAIKHTPENTAVKIDCSLSGKSLRIQIDDQGPGVPPALLPRLFTPFFKHGEHSGHGLGLAIAKKSIQRANGSLTARNGVPRGLVVTIELPT